MYAQLGDITFDGILTPESQEHNRSVNYAEHPLIDGKPRLQRVGDGLDEIKITMHLHRLFCTPEEEVLKLTNHMVAGTPLRYVTGAGSFVGQFVIINTKQVHAQQGPTGRVVETSLEVTLKEAFEETDESVLAKDAITRGFAQQKNSPAVGIERITPIAPTTLASQGVTGGLANNQTAGLQLQQAQVNTNQQTVRMRGVADSARRMRDSFVSAINWVNTTSGEVYDQTRNLESALVNTLGTIANFREAAEANNILDALDAFDALQPLMFNVRRESEILAAYNASRIPING
jgi:phage protein U